MAGNGFSEEKLLTLTDERALLIWYKLQSKPLFKGIEWSSLSAELVDKHHSYFTANELAELSDGKPQAKEAVNSAIQRHPQGVLHAFYTSLWDTQSCGGATQHARIVEEIQKETLATPGLQQPAFTTPATHLPATVPDWPSLSRLASAEHDRGLPIAQTDATATINHPHWQTRKASAMIERQKSFTSRLASTEDRRPGGVGSHVVDSGPQASAMTEWQDSIAAAESASHQCTDIPSPAAQLDSTEHSRPPRLNSREESGPQGEANGDASGQMEVLTEWEDIVAFIQCYFDEKETHRDVFREILMEMLGVRARQYLHPSLRKQELSVALQAVVQECSMTWFQFAQYLLRAKSARPYIFEIEKHTGGFIPFKFKAVLKLHLGRSWYQLGTTMGLPRGPLQAIQVKFVDDLPMQIDTFLGKYKFPTFESDQRTAQFLVETLEKASLPQVATDVKKRLEVLLNIEIGSAVRYVPDQRPQDVLRSLFHGVGASFSEEANLDASAEPQDSERNEARNSPLTSQHNDPGIRQFPSAEPMRKVHSDTDQQESGQKCVMEGNATILPATMSPCQPTADSVDTNLENGLWDGSITLIHDTEDHNASAIFAEFDEQQSEGTVWQMILDRTCPGLLLVRQEDEKQLIHFAAERGYTTIVENLLETGYDINVRMKNGQTPFLLACEAGHEDTIRFLLRHNAGLVSSKDALRRSCLHFPAVLRNKNLTQYLIWDMDADIDAKSTTGITPLSVGCIMGDLSIVQDLVQAMRLKLSRSEASAVSRRKLSRLPPLHAAAYGGHQHIMEFLLKLKINEHSDHEGIVDLVDQELRSDFSYTALHIAASRGHKDIVEMLVEQRKCMVNASARDATTPLLLAATSGHEDVVEYLLKHHADIDSMREVRRGAFHLTPLGEAALGRHVKVVRLLLDAGADFTFKAGGTTSILALACIGGDEEIVHMLLHKLSADIGRARERNTLHEIFEMPFVVSMDFEDYKCAKQLMGYMNEYFEDIDHIIRTFSGKVDSHMIDVLRRYKEIIDLIPGTELSNQGDTCRRVAGSRSSPMYHLCYDDGPHWGTEPMQLCFMFETFSKPGIFHNTYEKVYMEASKCILQTLRHMQGYSYESLANEALARGSEEAAVFFSQYGENQLKDRVLFLEQIHSGNPSAMGVCCELVLADVLQETYTSELAGPVAQQYFMEMSRREEKHPGQFRMKFSTHGATGTGVRLRKSGQAAPQRRPHPPPAAYNAPKHKKPSSADIVPNPPSTNPQLPASDKGVTSTALVPWEDKPATLEASGSQYPPYVRTPSRIEVKSSISNTAEEPSLSVSISGDNLCKPEVCSQDNGGACSLLLRPYPSNYDMLKGLPFPIPPGSSAPSPLSRIEKAPHSDPSHIGRTCRLSQQQNSPDVRAPLPHGAASDSSGTHSLGDKPPPPSSPLLELHHTPYQNTGVAQHTSKSVSAGHSPKTVPTHMEAQSGTELPSQSSQGYPTLNHSNMGLNPLWTIAAEHPMLTSTGLPQQPQHQNGPPENTKKSEFDTGTEQDRHSDVVRSTESVAGVNRSSSPLLPQAYSPPQLSSQPAPASVTQPTPASVTQPTPASVTQPTPASVTKPAPASVTKPTPAPVTQPVPASVAQPTPASVTQPSPPHPPHLSATAEGPRLSRPDTIGGDFQDDMPPAPQPIAVVGAPHRQESDEGLAESLSSEGSTAAARSSNKPAPSNSADFVHVQNSSQVGTPHASYKSYASPSVVPTKEPSLSSRVESHPVQQSAAAPHEDGFEEEDSVDGNDDDAKSDMTYASSTSVSTTHNPPADESRKSSLSRNLHPSVPWVLPNTAHLKTASEGSLSVSIQTPTASSQSIAAGEEQAENSGQSVLTPVNGCEPPLSSHPNWPPSSPPSQQPSTPPDQPPFSHPSQTPSPHHDNSFNLPSHVHPAMVEPSRVPSVMESSMEAQSAATVVEALHEADLLATSSSSMHLEQPLADSCDESATAVPFTVPGFERHDSGYTGSNQFSSVLLGHHGNTESRGTMSMEGYQMEQDPKESVQHADSMAVIDNQPIGSLTKEEEEMLEYLCRQVGQKWSMLARYAGLTEDDVQDIKCAQLEGRSRVTMEKIQLQGRLTWNDLLHIVHKQLHMLNTAAELQRFLHHPVDALPLDVIQKVIDPQQYGRTILLASQCVSEHWRELARHWQMNVYEHWDVLEQSSEADEKCHELLMLWLRENTGATLQQLLEAVESTSASAGTLRQLIEIAQ